MTRIVAVARRRGFRRVRHENWPGEVKVQARCPKCQEALTVSVVKEAVIRPQAVKRLVKGTRLTLSWWNHGLDMNLRWLAVVAGLVLAGFAGRFFDYCMSQLQSIPAGQVDWALACHIFLVLVVGGRVGSHLVGRSPDCRGGLALGSSLGGAFWL